MPLSQTLDTPGPMTRNMADLALMFSIMKGVDGHKIDTDMMNGRWAFRYSDEYFQRFEIWHY